MTIKNYVIINMYIQITHVSCMYESRAFIS